MNFDQRWCDLSVRDFLVLERAWGWATAMVQLVIVGGAVWVGRVLLRRWQARRSSAVVPESHEAPPAPLELPPPHEAYFDDERVDGFDPLGHFGVPLTVRPPDQDDPIAFWRGWCFPDQAAPPPEVMQPGGAVNWDALAAALAEPLALCSRCGKLGHEPSPPGEPAGNACRAAMRAEMGKRPPEDPPRSVVGPEDPTPTSAPKPRE